jgi:uncharacterized RDD family membrane protein YckC
VTRYSFLAYSQQKSIFLNQIMTNVSDRIKKWRLARNQMVGLRSEIGAPSLKPICLVLMSFSKEHDSHFTIIRRTGESAGFDCIRVETPEGDDPIVRQILRNILRADIIVADLSEDNANVFYEVGMSQALLRKVILVRSDTENIPFDLAAYRVLKIPDDADANGERRNWPELVQALTTIADSNKIGGPVADVLGQLSIRVGENLFWRRLIGHAIDVYAMVFLLWGLFFVLGVKMSQAASQTAKPIESDGVVIGLGLFTVYFLWHTVLVAVCGRTPGKFLVGIVVKPRYGDKVGWPQALIRAGVQTFGWFSLGMPLFFAAIGPNYEGLHDRMSRTIVVRRPFSWRRSGR